MRFFDEMRNQAATRFAALDSRSRFSLHRAASNVPRIFASFALASALVGAQTVSVASTPSGTHQRIRPQRTGSGLRGGFGLRCGSQLNTSRKNSRVNHRKTYPGWLTV